MCYKTKRLHAIYSENFITDKNSQTFYIKNITTFDKHLCLLSIIYFLLMNTSTFDE